MRGCISHVRVMLVLLAASLLASLVVADSSLPICNASSSVIAVRGDVVNVAVLVWTPPPPDPRASRIAWGNRSPLLDGWNATTLLERRVLQSWLLFQEMLTAKSPLPGVPALTMADGAILRINISYFGMGPFATLRGSDEYSDRFQNSTQHTLIKQLADPNGTYGRFHFLLTPMSSNTPLSILTSLACEKTRTCMAIGTVRRANNDEQHRGADRRCGRRGQCFFCSAF